MFYFTLAHKKTHCVNWDVPKELNLLKNLTKLNLKNIFLPTYLVPPTSLNIDF